MCRHGTSLMQERHIPLGEESGLEYGIGMMREETGLHTTYVIYTSRQSSA